MSSSALLEWLKALGVGVVLIGLAVALVNYRRSVRTRRAEWLASLHEKRGKPVGVACITMIDTLGVGERRALVATVGGASVASEKERLDLTLGVTCHAVYHAGQIQLIKVLR